MARYIITTTQATGCKSCIQNICTINIISSSFFFKYPPKPEHSCSQGSIVMQLTRPSQVLTGTHDGPGCLPPLVCIRPSSSGRAAVSALVLTIVTFPKSRFINLSLGDLEIIFYASSSFHFHVFLTVFTMKVMQLLRQR